MNKGRHIAIMSISHQRRITLWARLGSYVFIVLATRNAKLGKSLEPSSFRCYIKQNKIKQKNQMNQKNVRKKLKMLFLKRCMCVLSGCMPVCNVHACALHMCLVSRGTKRG